MEQLSAYLDGELPEGEAREVEEALRRDAGLAAELRRLGAVRDLLRRLPRVQAPPDLAEHVLARAERAHLLSGVGETGSAGGAVLWLGRLATAAVVLVALGIGIAVITWLTTPSWLDRRAAHVDRPPVPRKSDEVVMDEAARRARAARAPAAPAGGPPAAPAPMPAPMPPDLAAAPKPTDKVAVPGPVLEARPDGVMYFVINTPAPQLQLTQQRIEGVLSRNRVAPAEGAAVSMDAKVGPQANVYNLGPGKVGYPVVASQEQIRQIVKELNEIRAAQNVAQVPLTEAGKLGAENAGAMLAAAEALRQSVPTAPPATPPGAKQGPEPLAPGGAGRGGAETAGPLASAATGGGRLEGPGARVRKDREKARAAAAARPASTPTPADAELGKLKEWLAADIERLAEERASRRLETKRAAYGEDAPAVAARPPATMPAAAAPVGPAAADRCDAGDARSRDLAAFSGVAVREQPARAGEAGLHACTTMTDKVRQLWIILNSVPDAAELRGAKAQE